MEKLLMNFKKPVEHYNKGGGETGVLLNVLTGKTYGSAPIYGELPYQYYKSKYGYDLGQQRIRIKNNIKYMIPK